MILVRPAHEADIPWLMAELREFDQFFGAERSLYPDEETARATIGWMIAHGSFFVAEQENVPLGFIAGVLTPHPYNPSLRTLTETFWWVKPDSRGSRAGAALLDYFVAYGQQNADWIVFTLEDASPVNPRTLTKRGFRLKETSYLLECGCVAQKVVEEMPWREEVA